MDKATIILLFNILDYVAIAIFMAAGLFAIIKPEKTYYYACAKKNRGIKPDAKKLKSVRIYGTLILVAVGIGLVEIFI